MTRLALALTDLAPPAEPAELPARMPALERLLARADRLPATAPTWRHWLLRRGGMAVPDGELPLAGMALGRSGAFAFATPLHLVAGLEQVHLHPGGPLRLGEDEQATLARDLRNTFGGPELPFGYVSLEGHEDVVTHDPGALLGHEAGRWLPGGAGGAWLRRYMTELQMWLHDHPLNSARVARGELAVNCLWIWGLGRPENRPTGKPTAVLASDDTALEGAWLDNGGTTVAGGPQGWLGQRSVAASVALAAIDADANRALQRADAEYLAPLLAALGAGGLESLDLWLANRVYRLRPVHRWRMWRWPRPWWESLA